MTPLDTEIVDRIVASCTTLAGAQAELRRALLRGLADAEAHRRREHDLRNTTGHLMVEIDRLRVEMDSLRRAAQPPAETPGQLTLEALL